MTILKNWHKLRTRRKELRNNPTPAEKYLWQFLKHKKIGLKFRRQYSIGSYIVDFVCLDAHIIIEVDGSIHNSPEAQEYDKQRSDFLQECGYSVYRFKNEDVLFNTPAVIDAIVKILQESMP